jgi:hypothetical protein
MIADSCDSYANTRTVIPLAKRFATRLLPEGLNASFEAFL